MCEGFSHFGGFLHHFLLAIQATTSIRVKDFINAFRTPYQELTKVNLMHSF